MKYLVAINKAYFPKEIWPKGFAEEFFETVVIKAKSRSDAAKLAWVKYGNNWLNLMGKQNTSKRKVSLNVSDPKSITNGSLGRLPTILVFDSSINLA